MLCYTKIMQIDYAHFYTSLGVIVLIAALGFFLGRHKLINANTNKQLVNLLLSVFMPAALFSAFPEDFSSSYSHLFFMGLLGGFVVMLGMILLAKLFFNKKFYKKDLSYEAQFAFIFNNATFLGYPIISTAFGEQGIVPYCGFIIAFNLALFSYGVWLFERKFSRQFFRRVITNPNIIAVLLGMILFLTHIALPSVINSAVSYTASATTPLSLICIGYMLSAANIKKALKKWKLLLIAALQLIVAPLFTFGILTLLRFPAEVIIVSRSSRLSLPPPRLGSLQRNTAATSRIPASLL